jgi:branched-chain amino acid transport system permease protein
LTRRNKPPPAAKRVNDLPQTILIALTLGSLYALIALGYTMVYGILKLINFAHGDIVVLGAWFSHMLAVTFLRSQGWNGEPPAPASPWWLGPVVLVGAMALAGAVGLLVERLAYRPLRSAPRLNVLITAIGVSLLLQNVGQLQFNFFGGAFRFPFGTQPEPMPALASHATIFSFRPWTSAQPVVLDSTDAIIILTAGLLLVALEILIYRTKIGLAMRAVSHNVQTAGLMGIPVDRVITFTFVLGSCLAAAAGLLLGLKYHTIQQPAHFTWVLLGMKAFVAAVVGGIGNVRGAVVGGFLIAFIEMLGARYVSSSMNDVYVFAVLILVLLARPSGLFGSATREKV